MSRRFAAQTHHNSVVFNVQTKPVDAIVDLYGIEVDEDGGVYDPFEMKEFSSLLEWAVYTEKQERLEAGNSFEKRGSKHYYEDEDY